MKRVLLGLLLQLCAPSSSPRIVVVIGCVCIHNTHLIMLSGLRKLQITTFGFYDATENFVIMQKIRRRKCLCQVVSQITTYEMLTIIMAFIQLRVSRFMKRFRNRLAEGDDRKPFNTNIQIRRHVWLALELCTRFENDWAFRIM